MDTLESTESGVNGPLRAVRDVPYIAHSGFELVGAGPSWAIAAADQKPEYTSHAGTFQGAILYGLAETAVSALLASLAGPDLLSTDLMVAGASIGFGRPARDRVTAHATLSESIDRIRTRLARDGNTALAVVVRLRDASGTDIGHAEFSCRATRQPVPGANRPPGLRTAVLPGPA
jgi:acyl-coenzyme A thioesterase PaaI-like protein